MIIFSFSKKDPCTNILAMKKFTPLLISSALFALTVPSQGICESSFFGQQEMQIFINNRILAKVNGRAISVIDLMKKMDMLFYRQFPEFTSSTQARYQFYQANWKHVFQEFLDKELILADATEIKLPISGGDVRQEMESMFGPNIISNLDRIGLTFEEAYKMVKDDITIRRMIYIRVQNKASREITPQVIRSYYEEYAKDNIRDNEWEYQVVSIRDKDSKQAAEIAQKAYQLLVESQISLNELPQKINDIKPALAATITVSEAFIHKEKDLSDAFRETISNQKVGTFSEPLLQKSRATNSTLYRIFYLKNMKSGGMIPFGEIESQLKERLLDKALEKETEAYLKKLRQHFDVQTNFINEDFEPFLLK